MAKEQLNIVFENENFVAVNKPAGLLSIPDREQKQVSLKDILFKKYGNIFTVHRLDKDTSGIIVFAKNESIHKYLSQLFESRSVEKYYLGLVHGIPVSKKGIIDMPIGEHSSNKGMMTVHSKGKPSLTGYEIVEEFRNYCLVQFQLHTGRTHQIRVHAKHIGHPLVCDDLYGNSHPLFLSSIKKKFKLSKQADEEKPILNRIALHAHQLKFKDQEKNDIDLIAALPKDIKAVLQQLKKNN